MWRLEFVSEFIPSIRREGRLQNLAQKHRLLQRDPPDSPVDLCKSAKCFATPFQRRKGEGGGMKQEIEALISNDGLANRSRQQQPETRIMNTQTLFKIRKLSQALTIMAFSTVLLSPTTTHAELKKGDRIVFLGDSITQAGANPGGYVTLVREAIQKQHPDLGVEVLGAGISGNRVPDLEKRLDRDVLEKKPTIVVIYIGINDVWHSQNGRGTPRDEFEAGLKRIIEKINQAGARVILCTPSVIGEKHDLSNPLDGMLEEFCGVSRKVAAGNEIAVARSASALRDSSSAEQLRQQRSRVAHLRLRPPERRRQPFCRRCNAHSVFRYCQS